MAIKKNNNKKNSLSRSSDKKGELLIKVDELMQKLSDNYGPFLLDELQKRLESTINEFNSDLKSILEESFNNHNMKSDNIVSDDKSDVPTFIAKYEEKVKKK